MGWNLPLETAAKKQLAGLLLVQVADHLFQGIGALVRGTVTSHSEQLNAFSVRLLDKPKTNVLFASIGLGQKGYPV